MQLKYFLALVFLLCSSSSFAAVNLTAVNHYDLTTTAASFVIPLVAPINESRSIPWISMSAANSIPSSMVAFELNSTHIKGVRQGTNSITVHADIAEYNSGVTTQYYKLGMGTNSTYRYTLTTPVNVSNTFLVSMGRTSNGSTWNGMMTTNDIINSTHGVWNASLANTAAYDNITFATVSVDGATVEHLTVPNFITGTDFNRTVNITPVTNLSRTFLLWTQSTSGTANLGRRAYNAYLTNTTNVNWTRSLTGTTEIIARLSVIQLPDGFTTQEKIVSMNTSDTSKITTISTVNTTRTAVFAGGGAMSGQSMGSNSGASSQYANAFTNLTNSTTINTERTSIAVTSIYTVYAIESPITYTTDSSGPTGGTIYNYTNSTGSYSAHIFTSSGTFTTSSALNISVVVVGGGAGGGGTLAGNGGAGGGGAGGYRNTNFTLSAGSYAVTVGAGGAGGTSANMGVNGSFSNFSTIKASGGGGGSKASGGGFPGMAGGSGGGSYYGSAPGTGNAGGYTPKEGNNGSTGCNGGSPYYGGSGGGSASNASPAVCGTSGLVYWAGNGTLNNISGTATYYAGGGGGGTEGTTTYQGVRGGLGGGGNGGNLTANPTAGAANTGGGGGGGSGNNGGNASNYAGAAGGSGIVIIVYQLSAGSPQPDTLEYGSTTTNNTLAGNTSNISIALSATGTKNLSVCIPSLDNGTGVYVNQSAVALSGQSANCYFSARLNPTVGSTINVKFYFNSTNSTNVQSNVSDVYSFVTTVESAGEVLFNWTFDNGLLDATNRQNLTSRGATITTSNYRWGNASAEFPNGNDNGLIGTAYVVPPNRTLSMWFYKIEATVPSGDLDSLFSFSSDDTGKNWAVFVYNDTVCGGHECLGLSTANASGSQRAWCSNYSETGSIPLNNWTHIVISQTNANVPVLQYNGIIVNMTQCWNMGSAFDATGASLTVRIGQQGTLDTFNGTIDEVKFWNRSLTTAEMLAQYVPNSCTCTPGQNFNVLGIHQCTVTTNCNLANYNLTCTGVGRLTLNNANITGAVYKTAVNSCNITGINGGGLR